MTLDKISLYVIKTASILVYFYAYAKFKVARKIDPTLKPKFNLRSKIELGLVLGLNILSLFYMAPKHLTGVHVFLAAILFLVTYLQLERMVVVGRKIIYSKFLAFDLRQIRSKKYERGKFVFNIQGQDIKVRFPVTDTEHMMQMLSGSYRKRKNSK